MCRFRLFRLNSQSTVGARRRPCPTIRSSRPSKGYAFAVGELSRQASFPTGDLNADSRSAGREPCALIGFFVANLISWVAADNFIQGLYDKRFNEIVKSNPDQTLRDAQAKSEAWRNKLDLEFGKQIGRIERVFYIYAVMFTQFSLLSAWVILKAFYGWIQKPSVAQSAAPEEDKITTFYAYIYGNALSLILALTLGHFGLLVSQCAECLAFVTYGSGQKSAPSDRRPATLSAVW